MTAFGEPGQLLVSFLVSVESSSLLSFSSTQILIHNFPAQTLLLSRSLSIVDRIYSIFKFSLFSAVLSVNRRTLESAMCMFSTTCRLEIVFLPQLRRPLSHVISELLTTQTLLNIRDMDRSFFP